MHPYQQADVRDLLGMRSRGAWLIVACYVTAMVTVTVATIGHLTAVWPAVLGTAILVAATIVLVAVPGDPLPTSVTLALTAAGPLACALYLAVTPAFPQFSLQTWIHGGGTTLYCFMSVRGRRIAPWIGLAGMIAVFGFWASETGQGATYGISLVAVDAAPLAMSALLSFTLRPTAHAVFSLRAQRTAKIAELSSQSAASDERSRQLRDLDNLVRPLLERIASGTELTDAERIECALLEAHLRDRLRAPLLSALDLDAAAYRARTRGIDVVFIDDRSPRSLDDQLGGVLYTAVADALDTAHAGQVCVRVLPADRATVASILTRDRDRTRLQEIDQDGRIHTRVG
ncbi:MAG: hypothetical protein WAX14_04960 [Rhodococcus sp. (in: high G+C Gram-positive bacteria)]|uniref:hypothetical protein n=1 Tax=Rhodococcus sp. TaxID=1831 RepID=UPI003BB6370A